MSGPTRHRDPDEVLAELGHRLDAGYAASPSKGRGRLPRRAGTRRPALRALRPRWRWAACGAVLTLLAGPTAVATHDTLFGTAPPRVPVAAGDVAADAAGAPVQVAQGSAGSVPWRLSASACRFGAVRAVGVFLDVPGGGAGARCDVASRPADGAAPSPLALRDRRVQTYVDPLSGRTWAFGVLPGGATSVRVVSRDLEAGGARPATRTRATPVAMDPRALTRGVPAGLRVFVIALPGAREVSRTDVFADGRPVLRCGAAGSCRPVRAVPVEESRP